MDFLSSPQNVKKNSPVKGLRRKGSLLPAMVVGKQGISGLIALIKLGG